MTEAFATVDMPVASKKRANLRCKVDTGAGGNMIPLQAFAKLFPNRLTKLECPQDYENATPSLELTVDTPITWKDEETKEVNKMDTTFLYSQYTRTSNLRITLL